ncbi:hypothetical protein DF185_01070 [Marinifilum breve]|uniref:Phage abortive infection protein n=1 Tax=Marinifilum breve TaxID=2184082 RepID=A0A2V4A1G3_9BACT|nr:putative phage abortive infection protein [Marinifilum breve]PXY02715.1 hypothetical protein DF185_01070 [Marinifilum breve]
MNKTKKTLLYTLLVFVVSLTIVLCLPYWLTRTTFFESGIAFSKTGEIGDTIGGIMGPFVAIIAAGLTFLAFWIQYEANSKHVDQFESQSKQNSIDRFESKFFEMIKLHRDNVNELRKFYGHEMGGVIFYSLIKEFMIVYEWTQVFIREHSLIDDEEIAGEEVEGIDIREGQGLDDDDDDDDDDEFWVQDFLEEDELEDVEVANILRELNTGHIFDIAYKTFFIGLKEVSINTLKDHLGEYDIRLINRYLDYMSQEKNGYDYFENQLSIMDGHLTDLAHYFRHLYQTVKLIVEIPDDLMNDTERYEYIRILRSQLSDHEQLLLIINGQSEYGKEWLNRNLFSYWKVVKNAPKEQIELLEINVDDYFTSFVVREEAVTNNGN